jgi:isoleucyl-tRNA synthetase
VRDLEERGLLWRHVAFEHAYPHCWRCHTPLLYYAQPSWYIRTTEVKDALLRENEATTWYPETIKWGRYGDWLRNNVDWALSRNRYWGTPLPIWRCNDADPCSRGVRRVAGRARRAGRQDLSDLDPHRPYVDDVTFTLPGCGAPFRRVPEVIDVWYDSGAMPFAQWGYPHWAAEAFARQYPAQFICEAIDQTRGWFYTLMAVGTLVFDQSSYENVLCLGHILAEDGRKMSKHLGNVLEPIPLMDEHGADAVRWFMAASGSPWLPRRVGHAAIRRWSARCCSPTGTPRPSSRCTPALADWNPIPPAPEPARRPVLDRWALSELHRLVGRRWTDGLEASTPQRPGSCSRASSTTCPTGTCAGHGGASGTATPPRWPRCTSAWTTADPAHGARSPRSSPSGCGRTWCARRPDGRLGAPGGVPDAPGPWSTTSSPSRSRSSAGSSSWAGRRAPRRRCAPASRWPCAGVGARGWDGLDEELRDQVAEELNVLEMRTLAGGAGRHLVEYQREGQLPVVGQALRQAAPRRWRPRSPPPMRPRSPRR